jgi:site-specific DNA-adenine methylase
MFTTPLPIQQVVEPLPFVQERSSYKETLKSSLNDQLSQAWEIIRQQEEEQIKQAEQTIDTTKNTD